MCDLWYLRNPMSRKLLFCDMPVFHARHKVSLFFYFFFYFFLTFAFVLGGFI